MRVQASTTVFGVVEGTILKNSTISLQGCVLEKCSREACTCVLSTGLGTSNQDYSQCRLSTNTPCVHQQENGYTDDVYTSSSDEIDIFNREKSVINKMANRTNSEILVPTEDSPSGFFLPNYY